MAAVSVEITEELLERIAERAAELLAGRQGDEPGGFLDVAGAADFLACPKSRIYALVSAKRLPHHRDGSRLLAQTIDQSNEYERVVFEHEALANLIGQLRDTSEEAR